MAELGEESLAEHKALLELIGQYHWDKVVLVGGDFLKMEHPYLQFEEVTKAKEWLKQQQPEETYLLIKGSRSIQMEKVLPD